MRYRMNRTTVKLGLVAMFGFVSFGPASAHESLQPMQIEDEETVVSANWDVDYEASDISFSGEYNGTVFSGGFKAWSADIFWDPEAIEIGSVSAMIETGTLSTGNETYDGTLEAEEWFDPNTFPVANVNLSNFQRDGDDFVGDATITIKEASLTTPFTFSIVYENDSAEMIGTATLSRAELDLGQSSDPGGDWVSPDIAVSVTVSASRHSGVEEPRVE